MMDTLAREEAEFFGLEGNQITLSEWVNLFKSNPLNLQTYKNGYYVLTTWNGVDMPDPMTMLGSRYGWRNWQPNETPMIYRSLVFNPDLQTIESAQYTTEDDAYEGHAQLVEKYEQA